MVLHDRLKNNLTGGFNDAGEAFNQVTDTFGDGAAQLVSDGGEAFNQVTDTIGDVSAPVVSVSGDAFNQVTDTIGDATSDTLTDIQKRTQNMLLNPEEQVKKAVEQGQI